MKITSISQDAMALKGFDDRGCFGCSCKDSCCRCGADFDKESYDLLLESRKLVEEKTRTKIRPQKSPSFRPFQIARSNADFLAKISSILRPEPSGICGARWLNSAMVFSSTF